MPVVTISGTSGANAVTISTAGIYSVNLGSGDDSLYDSVATQITAHGGVGNDSLSVSYSTGLIYGDSGVDTVQVSFGTYTVFGGTGADTFVLNASTASSTNVNKSIGYNEITDFSVGDELDLQDHSGTITSVSGWSSHASFFTTGSNLVVQFHNTTATHTTPFLVFDGLGGHGFHSFADMQAAGYTIVAT